MKWFLNAKAFIATSYVLFLGSIIGFLLGITGIYPQGEPPVVLAISWLALVFSAYGNIISATVNKKIDKG